MLFRELRLPHRLRRGTPDVSTAAPSTIDGLIEERTSGHVAGWIRDAADPDARIGYEIVQTSTGRVLATGIADQYRHRLDWRGIGDGAHGFHARLSVPAMEQISVRPAGGPALAVSPDCRASFLPLQHVAMDIVDNCNLRCPFCLYDYSNTRTTNFMTRETLQSALKLLPYVQDGQFWFSCLHEPTLHPELTDFIDLVPLAYRKKLFYTTNLAKRMPDSYFEWLAHSGMFNINISIESRDPAIYERMRRGARHRIFQENWEKLLDAFSRAPAPPLLRYIAMAYKSNIDELPELSSYLLEQCQAWQVELRYTFDLPFIPAAFRDTEFLDGDDWRQLRKSLPAYPADRLILIAPPEAGAEITRSTPARYLNDYYMLSVSYDGTMRVRGFAADARRGSSQEYEILTTNLDAIGDPETFFAKLR